MVLPFVDFFLQKPFATFFESLSGIPSEGQTVWILGDGS